ncbi:hypothetical protein SFC50_11525 [Bacillus infantis]|uniref:hypothetical protein n=1 Tax=Bacillus infantis TaxID=324767 RepID=UPI003982280F
MNAGTEKEQIEIKPPDISESTMKEMAQFFMKTSIPRILAKQKNELGGKENHE